MNRTLAKTALDQLAFLVLCTDDEFDSRIALKQTEAFGGELHCVSLDEQRELVDYAKELAPNQQPAERAEIYASLQEGMGLLEYVREFRPQRAIDEIFTEFLIYLLANYARSKAVKGEVGGQQTKRIAAELRNLTDEERREFVTCASREARTVRERALGNYRDLAEFFESIESVIWPDEN